MTEGPTVDDDDAILKQLAGRIREEREEPELPDGVAPFDDQAADAIAARILGGEARAPVPASAEPAPSPATSDEPHGPASAPAPASAKVLRPAFRWALAPVAAAAAVALWVASQPGEGSLPSYEVAVIGAKELRADPQSPSTGEISLDPRGDFELLARPAAPAPGVRAHAVLVRDGAARPWSAPIEISDEGAVRVAGTTEALFPETRGAYEVVLVVATEAWLPSREEAARIASGAGAPSSSAVRAIRARVRFVDRE
jgi:hypothetical protein